MLKLIPLALSVMLAGGAAVASHLGMAAPVNVSTDTTVNAAAQSNLGSDATVGFGLSKNMMDVGAGTRDAASIGVSGSAGVSANASARGSDAVHAQPSAPARDNAGANANAGTGTDIAGSSSLNANGMLEMQVGL